jgi:hypothetical protein
MQDLGGMRQETEDGRREAEALGGPGIVSVGRKIKV